MCSFEWLLYRYSVFVLSESLCVLTWSSWSRPGFICIWRWVHSRGWIILKESFSATQNRSANPLTSPAKSHQTLFSPPSSFHTFCSHLINLCFTSLFLLRPIWQHRCFLSFTYFVLFWMVTAGFPCYFLSFQRQQATGRVDCVDHVALM